MRPALLLCALAIAAPMGASAGQSPDDKVTPLFRSDSPLDVTLKADFRQVFRDRDTTRQDWQPGVIEWTADGAAASMPIELTTRGHFRLQSRNCSFPPIRLRFDREKRQGTLWDKQGTLKLGTHCRNNYEQLVLVEHLSYRIYNAITDASFRVRLARMAYQHPDAKVDSLWGFFIEDDEDMARRLDGEAFGEPGVSFAFADSTAVATMSAFLFMIGMTDWSLPYLHNVRVIKRQNDYLPVPYDFDWSGLVNAPYARPDPRLDIRTVRHRVWRGPCVSRGLLDIVLDRFVAQQEAIMRLIQTQPGLEDKKKADTAKYVGEFFELAQDRDKLEREIKDQCR